MFNRIIVVIQRLRSPLAGCPREKPLGFLPRNEGISQVLWPPLLALLWFGKVSHVPHQYLPPASTLFTDSRALTLSEELLASARKFFHSDPAHPQHLSGET